MVRGKLKAAHGVRELHAALASILAGIWLSVEDGQLRAEFELRGLMNDHRDLERGLYLFQHVRPADLEARRVTLPAGAIPDHSPWCTSSCSVLSSRDEHECGFAREATCVSASLEAREGAADARSGRFARADYLTRTPPIDAALDAPARTSVRNQPLGEARPRRLAPQAAHQGDCRFGAARSRQP